MVSETSKVFADVWAELGRSEAAESISFSGEGPGLPSAF